MTSTRNGKSGPAHPTPLAGGIDNRQQLGGLPVIGATVNLASRVWRAWPAP